MQTRQIRCPVPFVTNKYLVYMALVVISVPRPLLLANRRLLTELHRIAKQETKAFGEAGVAWEREG